MGQGGAVFASRRGDEPGGLEHECSPEFRFRKLDTNPHGEVTGSFCTDDWGRPLLDPEHDTGSWRSGPLHLRRQVGAQPTASAAHARSFSRIGRRRRRMLVAAKKSIYPRLVAKNTNHRSSEQLHPSQKRASDSFVPRATVGRIGKSVFSNVALT